MTRTTTATSAGWALPGRLQTADRVMRGAARLRLLEPELEGLRGVVGPGDVCFDVGAAYGMYAIPLAAAVGPTGAVHAFEPQRRPRAVLSAARSLLGAAHVRISHSAVGRVAGEHELVLVTRYGLRISGHAHLAGSAGSRDADRLRVPVTTIDDVCREQGIERVRFVKADVEGFEHAVLEGAAEALERDRPAVLLEIEDRHLQRYGLTGAEVADSLRDRGYEMAVWRGGAWQAADRVVTGTRNYLFQAPQG
ncbi:FkbM family methyltransferase [Agrococcus sp. KRD186]|uniref:FkbM family methyltransferase n=1 Tax=Agrococcus sp. KRD186 TaxID=2729730 RepID=UPI0019D1DAB2|nr:FkbM family methyltransferase [Agrococcus sp. KRD186]